ncbi:hypothetical protein SAMN05444008_10110 [Cnuella takakiae]|uniref:Uncharacterized protein n=1 Tax=Cnuella takakiae TaxID=1302690 RepID=A0A1M4S851_9BACT|nr:hypothetical protein [Cnuella takakiae]OLY94411.1 hypothetical protein BUE76_22910 [Cnuella takakiae]SHE28386.1 hypothetical protein SAMN05444008_10110 [Cnuella takakiae]
MNCIEKLMHLECEPCVLNSKIIEFEQLPESEKYNFDYYDKVKDFLLYCEKCNVYKIVASN